jgi:hypothetical protein
MGNEMSLDAHCAKDCMSKPMGCFAKRKAAEVAGRGESCPDAAWVPEGHPRRGCRDAWVPEGMQDTHMAAFASTRLGKLPENAVAPRVGHRPHARPPSEDLFSEFLEARSADDGSGRPEDTNARVPGLGTGAPRRAASASSAADAHEGGGGHPRGFPVASRECGSGVRVHPGRADVAKPK